ncbi:uncharacterized protein LOC134803535 [Cydia splendana]|uniref:uncharacterized protein LOC134803535 n=1 Tax=Cydia splendana TaxID=1100963 RepID=UPI00300D5BBA
MISLYLLLVAFEKLPTSSLESPSSVLYSATTNATPWHLVRETCSWCHQLRERLHRPMPDDQLYTMYRKLQCLIYNVMCAAICRRRPAAPLYEQLLGTDALQRIVDEKEQYVLPIRASWTQRTKSLPVAVPLEPSTLSPSYTQRSRIFLRTLSEDPMLFDLHSSVEEQVEVQDISLVETPLNCHPCAGTLTALLRHAAGVSTLASLWRALACLLAGTSGKNLKWLLAQVICNCKEELKPQATVLLPGLLAVLASVEEGKFMNGLHLDVLDTILYWKEAITSEDLNIITHHLIRTCMENRRKNVFDGLLRTLQAFLELYGTIQVEWNSFEAYYEDPHHDTQKALFKVIKTISKTKYIPTVLSKIVAKLDTDPSNVSECFGLAMACGIPSEKGPALGEFRRYLEKCSGITSYVRVLYYASLGCAECCGEQEFRKIADYVTKVISSDRAKCLHILSCYLSRGRRSEYVVDMFDTIDLPDMIDKDQKGRRSEYTVMFDTIDLPHMIDKDQKGNTLLTKLPSVCSDILRYLSRGRRSEYVVDMFDTIDLPHMIDKDQKALLLVKHGLPLMEDAMKRRCVAQIAALKPATAKVRKLVVEVMQKAYEELFTTPPQPPAKRQKTDSTPILSVIRDDVYTNSVLTCLGVCAVDASEEVAEAARDALEANLDKDLGARFAECFLLAVYLPAHTDKPPDVCVCVSALLGMLFGGVRGAEGFKEIRLREEPLPVRDEPGSRLLTLSKTFQGTFGSYSATRGRTRTRGSPSTARSDANNSAIDVQISIDSMLQTLLDFAKTSTDAARSLLTEVLRSVLSNTKFDVASTLVPLLGTLLGREPTDLTPMYIDVCRVLEGKVGLLAPVERLRALTSGSEGAALTRLLYEEVAMRCLGDAMFLLGQPEDIQDVVMNDASTFSIEDLKNAFGKLSNWDDLTLQQRRAVRGTLPPLWTDRRGFNTLLDSYQVPENAGSWFDKMAAAFKQRSVNSWRWLRKADQWPRRHFEISAITEALSWQHDPTETMPSQLFKTSDCLAECAARLMIRSSYYNSIHLSERDDKTSKLSRSHELRWCMRANEMGIPNVALQCVERYVEDLSGVETLAWLRQKLLALRQTALERENSELLRDVLNKAEKYTPQFPSDPSVCIEMYHLTLLLRSDLNSLQHHDLQSILVAVDRSSSQVDWGTCSKEAVSSVFEIAVGHYDKVLETGTTDTENALSNMSAVVSRAAALNTPRTDMLLAVLLNRLNGFQGQLDIETARDLLEKVRCSIKHVCSGISRGPLNTPRTDLLLAVLLNRLNGFQGQLEIETARDLLEKVRCSIKHVCSGISRGPLNTPRTDLLLAVLLNRLNGFQGQLEIETARDLLEKLAPILPALDAFSLELLEKNTYKFPPEVQRTLTAMLPKDASLEKYRRCLQLVCDPNHLLTHYCEELVIAVRSKDGSRWKSTLDRMREKIFDNPYAGPSYNLLDKYKDDLYGMYEFEPTSEFASRAETKLKSIVTSIRRDPQSTLRLSDLCPTLLRPLDEGVERWFGLRGVKIVKFYDKVQVFTDSIRRPVVISMLLSCGRTHRVIQKTGEPLARDAASQRVASVASRGSGYSVTLLDEESALIEFLEGHERLRSMIATTCNLDVLHGVSRPADALLAESPVASLQAHEQLCAKVPATALSATRRESSGRRSPGGVASSQLTSARTTLREGSRNCSKVDSCNVECCSTVLHGVSRPADALLAESPVASLQAHEQLCAKVPATALSATRRESSGRRSPGGVASSQLTSARTTLREGSRNCSKVDSCNVECCSTVLHGVSRPADALLAESPVASLQAHEQLCANVPATALSATRRESSGRRSPGGVASSQLTSARTTLREGSRNCSKVDSCNVECCSTVLHGVSRPADALLAESPVASLQAHEQLCAKVPATALSATRRESSGRRSPGGVASSQLTSARTTLREGSRNCSKVDSCNVECCSTVLHGVSRPADALLAESPVASLQAHEQLCAKVPATALSATRRESPGRRSPGGVASSQLTSARTTLREGSRHCSKVDSCNVECCSTVLHGVSRPADALLAESPVASLQAHEQLCANVPATALSATRRESPGRRSPGGVASSQLTSARTTLREGSRNCSKVDSCNVECCSKVLHGVSRPADALLAESPVASLQAHEQLCAKCYTAATRRESPGRRSPGGVASSQLTSARTTLREGSRNCSKVDSCNVECCSTVLHGVSRPADALLAESPVASLQAHEQLCANVPATALSATRRESPGRRSPGGVASSQLTSARTTLREGSRNCSKVDSCNVECCSTVLHGVSRPADALLAESPVASLQAHEQLCAKVPATALSATRRESSGRRSPGGVASSQLTSARTTLREGSRNCSKVDSCNVECCSTVLHGVSRPADALLAESPVASLQAHEQLCAKVPATALSATRRESSGRRSPGGVASSQLTSARTTLREGSLNCSKVDSCNVECCSTVLHGVSRPADALLAESPVASLQAHEQLCANVPATALSATRRESSGRRSPGGVASSQLTSARTTLREGSRNCSKVDSCNVECCSKVLHGVSRPADALLAESPVASLQAHEQLCAKVPATALSATRRESSGRRSPGGVASSQLTSARTTLRERSRNCSKVDSCNVECCSTVLHGVSRPADALLAESPVASLQAHEQLCAKVPANALRSAMEQSSSCVQDFIWKKRNFTGSLADMTLLTWLLGLGDRHLQNIMCSRAGMVRAVDFGDVWRCSELPARLTRNLLAVSDIQVLEARLQSSLSAMRGSALLLEAAIRVAFHWMEPEIEDQMRHVRGILRGEASSYDVCRDVTGRSQHKYKQKYIQLLDRTLGDSHRDLYSVEEQISCLLRHCTSPELLSVVRAGWEPWV